MNGRDVYKRQVWGLSLLAVLSDALARAQRVPPWKVIGEHVVIGLCVVAITHYLGCLLYTSRCV